MYVWTQKGVDDYAIRHPYVKLKNIPRKVGEIATYDGKPLLSGEIQRAYTERGLIENTIKTEPATRTLRKKPKSKMPLDDEPPRKNDFVIWKKIHDLCIKGHTVVEISLECNMSVSKLETFVRINRKRLEKLYGKIRFKRFKNAG